MFFAKLVVDMTPSDDKFMNQALSSRVGYIGLCYSEAHGDALLTRAKKEVLSLMADPGSKLHVPAFAKSAPRV